MRCDVRLAFVAILLALSASRAWAADIEDEARGIARELACPVCQGLSVADSPAPLAGEMRELIRSKLTAGETREQILSYFAERYGDAVLLSPPRTGFTAVAWVAPYVGLGLAIVFLIWAVRRRAPETAADSNPADAGEYLSEVDRTLDRLRDEPLR